MTPEDLYTAALEAFVDRIRNAETAARRLDPEGPLTKALERLDEELAKIEREMKVHGNP